MLLVFTVGKLFWTELCSKKNFHLGDQPASQFSQCPALNDSPEHEQVHY